MLQREVYLFKVLSLQLLIFEMWLVLSLGFIFPRFMKGTEIDSHREHSMAPFPGSVGLFFCMYEIPCDSVSTPECLAALSCHSLNPSFLTE